MRKIASTIELQTELQRLLAYSDTKRPKRSRLARELATLGTRVAAESAESILKQVESRLKSKFSKLDFIIDDEGEDGADLTIERSGGRDPGDSFVSVHISADASDSSVSLHSSGPSVRSSDSNDFDDAPVSKLVAAAEKYLKKGGIA
jgi:hypothetical protein